MTSKTTKDRILDAAEDLYTEYGFADTSMRELTKLAEVNLAAVNYHFGSKEGLFRALIVRRFDTINAERLALLDELEALGEPSLEQVLEALVGPILRLRFSDPGAASQLVQVIGRLTSAKTAHTDDLSEIFQKTSERFLAALHGVLPPLPERESMWRINCAIGVLLGTMLDPHNFLDGGEQSLEPAYQERVLKHIVSFLAAALCAPAPDESKTLPSS